MSEQHAPGGSALVPPAHVLVTGADGLIGRATAAALLRRGYRVTALSLTWGAEDLPVERVHLADACDEAEVARALEGVDGLVHLAALPSPSAGSPREVFTTNTVSTFTVLSVAAQRGIRRAVVASSINAFGVPMNHHDVMPAYYPLDESSPVEHDDAYSLSKWVGESTARFVHSRWGMDVISLRFPWVRGRDELRTLAEEVARDEKERARLAREGWAYLALEDAASAVVAGLEASVHGAPTALVAADDTLLPEPTSRLLERYAPDVERRRDFPGRQVPVDTSRARRLLGWHPEFSLWSSKDDSATPQLVSASPGGRR